MMADDEQLRAAMLAYDEAIELSSGDLDKMCMEAAMVAALDAAEYRAYLEKQRNLVNGRKEMRIKYVFKYLTYVALGRLGWLTIRQIRGDVGSIWRNDGT
jgi:Zn-finger domain-containing protein